MIQSTNSSLGINFLMLDKNSIVEIIEFQTKATHYALQIYNSLDNNKQFSTCSFLYFIFQRLQTGKFYAILDQNRTNISLQWFFRQLNGVKYQTIRSQKQTISGIFKLMTSINFRQLYIFQRLKGVKQKQVKKTNNPFERAIMEKNLARISTLQEEENYLQRRATIENNIEQRKQQQDEALQMKNHQFERQRYIFGQNSQNYQIHMNKELIERYQSRIEQEKEQSQSIGKVIIDGREDIWGEKEISYKKTANRKKNLLNKKRKMY